MTSTREPSRKTTPDPVRAAERARLEGRLAEREAWRSLQELRVRPSGKGLMAAIETAAERDRLERELADTCEDYRAWIALSDSPGKDEAVTEPATLGAKPRVRVKAAAKRAKSSEPSPAHVKPDPSRPDTGTAPQAAARRSVATGPGRSRIAAEEASVVIVRRAKNGGVTRLELPVAGRPAPVRERMDRHARIARQLEAADDAAPQTIAKRPD